jgi:hypothetical protein
MIKIRIFKRRGRKEVKEEPNLVANGRFQCLMALGRFQVRWLLEGEGEGEASFSPLFILPPTNFTLTFFPLILRFYFTMVLDCYFRPFLDFSWFINCNHTSWCTKSSTHSLPSWFWLKIFSFLWIHGIAHDHVLWALSHTSEWRTTQGIILRFNNNLILSRWRS